MPEEVIMPGPDESEILMALTKLIVEMLEVDPSRIYPRATFQDDLELGSLDLLELVEAVEEKFDCSIPQSDLEHFSSIADVVVYLAERV
jgi:acyl carrier protein